MARTTALLIPCPWSGDENDPIPPTYRAWLWLYGHTRVLRHKVGLHDYKYVPATGLWHCSWCGNHTPSCPRGWF